ncbi:uncharacterized protein VICG_00333 [Vittaforma corneae ATCC 50505]|uniref:General transcription and DNA repair factor IIH subunit TFB4 n=1 Tax=Vittaforma corneae (strain ATCC 50505) TaxID=993615 RepID=L2GP32_VITCO|nr:uncharacterized protein VICG_00333 [Vittaforma corneae ATCC 50505]ELA42581.1 hypothetical protein VICG_00333 [Vittaforma corneae ATCC 50505]
MLLYILLDLNKPAWKAHQEDPLNNLQVFVNACILSDQSNTVKIINSKTVIFNSEVHKDFSSVFEYLNSKDDFERLKVTPKDLGFALMDFPTTVLIFEMTDESNEKIKNSQYLEYLKCMFVAQHRKIPIHGFSLHRNILVRMCCEGSGGIFLESCSFSDMFQLLGNRTKKKDAYQIKCACCNNFVTLGLVCPVCLLVYCKFMPVCKKCKTKFTFIN